MIFDSNSDKVRDASALPKINGVAASPGAKYEKVKRMCDFLNVPGQSEWNPPREGGGISGEDMLLVQAMAWYDETKAKVKKGADAIRKMVVEATKTERTLWRTQGPWLEKYKALLAEATKEVDAKAEAITEGW
jgi:hypothetical protein